MLLGVFGCGAGDIGVDESDAASETGSEGDGDSGDGDGDSGDGDSGDGDGDGDSGDGDGDGDGEVPDHACIEDGELVRALAIVDSSAPQVHVLEQGGDALILPAPLPEGIDADASVFASTSPDFIAVTTSYTVFVQPGVTDEGSVLRLFDRHSGSLLWEREFVDRRLGQVFVDGEGRVTAPLGWTPTPQPPAGVVVVDGELIELVSFAPAGPLGASDWMVGYVVNDLGEHVGSALYQPFTDELVQVTEPGTSWRPGDERIEYVDEAGPIPELVLARPDGELRIELSPFAGQEGSVNVDAVAGNFRLLSLTPPDDGPPILVRVQVASEELLAIDATLPAELAPFDCYFPRTSVDVEGRILFELRDAGAAQIHAWAPETEQWIALGVPMTNVDDIGVDGRFGRVELIQAHGTNMTFCPFAEWSDPPARALSGNSVQLARIEPPLSVIIDAVPFSAIAVDSAERCATWTDESGQRIHDLDDGDTLTLDVSGVAIWLD